MVDSPLSDTLDDLLVSDDEKIESEDDDQSTLFISNLSSNNELKLKIKKRKKEETSDNKEQKKKKKKNKSQPSYMRRNIRTLLTNDKLQDNTLSAIKAEQERLRRLEETNNSYQAVYPPPIIQPDEHECIVLDDDDDGDDDDDNNNNHHHIEEKQQAQENIISTVSTPKHDFETNSTKETLDNNEDSNDSDVQYCDSNTEVINDKLAKKLQRLHLDDRVNVPDENGNILVNVNHPNDEPDLYIPKHLCPILKAHQIGGIRFMYDNIVESCQRFQTTPGLGCILAHSMGCGKTVQVITFIDILLQNRIAKTVLIVVPINTIQNWANEFNRWCPIDSSHIEYKRSFQLYILNETTKKSTQRTKIVQNWSQSGGILVLGYEMFRLMVIKKATSTKANGNRSQQTRPITPVVVDLEEEEKNSELMEDVQNALLNPDLVICDEGHRIKNHQASVSVALKSIRTHRRIVLTGYPLQNNLIEYWCMVDFVRPNYLGSKLEFCNMFERPILNGQCIDSTDDDRRLMRARAHVLHSLLEGFIQRRGHDVLQADLPKKTEYVILLKLSPVQKQLYMKFLEAVGALSNSTEKTLNPLRAFAICCKIWNHPDVLYKFVRDRQDSVDFDFDFEIDQNKTKSMNRLSTQTITTNNSNESQPSMLSTIEKKEFDYDFANTILNSYSCGQLFNGIKFHVALSILENCIEIGDKVLIFSQSLLSLNKLEEFLSSRYVPNTDQKWEKNVNYYRLDGGTNSLEREKLINAFNAMNSNAKLFLLSTRAGCLGINLIAANRVIVMDVSWNPCLDAQAVCRVYRYGQKRHCFIYRLIADFTMEKRIYDRQVAKQGMSDRVVDELQPQHQFTRREVENLLHFAAEDEQAAPDLSAKIDEITTDPILISTCKQYCQSITKVPFTHESLLCDRKEHQLTSAEKRRAEQQYQNEKRMNSFSYRSRMPPSRSYPRLLNDHEPRPLMPNVPPILSNNFNYSTYQMIRPTTSMTPLPHHIQQQSKDRKLEQLRQYGLSVNEITLQNSLDVRLNGSQSQTIPAGVSIHIIKGPRGSYIRTPDGKFFTIRHPSTSSTSDQNEKLVILPPSVPSPLPQQSNFDINDPFLFGISNDTSLPTTTTASSAYMNDLNNRNDFLMDELPSNIMSSSSSSLSAFQNLSTWQNDYFQQNFYSNYFPTDSSSSSMLSSTNIDNDNSTNGFTTNPLTFM